MFEGSYINPNDYYDSTLMNFLTTVTNALPAEEMALVTAPSLDDISGVPVSGQKLWPLSTSEFYAMGTILDDPFTSGVEGAFWLRSPSNNASALVGFTGCEGIIDYGVGVSHIGVRPALYLNLASVLFTSDASGASTKSSATAGSGLIGAAAPTQKLKFTMQDSAQALDVLATAAQSTQSGASLSFIYVGATTGSNQYVSCVLRDELGAVKYYGKLVDSSSAASGTLSVPLSGVSDGTYTLELFSEQANADTYTDFASEPIAMTVSVSGGSGTVSGFGGTVLIGGEDGRDVELRNNGAAIQWRYAGEADDDWRDLVTLSSLTGATGADGKSAYELAVEKGYTGTLGEWLASLVGRTGATGATGALGASGTDGQNGQDGTNGKNGGQGNGIESIVKTDTDGNVDTYTMTFTNGTTMNFTVANGKNGVGLANGAVNESGELVFTLTDGSLLNLGRIAGLGEAIPASEAVITSAEKPDTAAIIALAVAVVALLSHLGWLIPLWIKKRNLASARRETL